jgi:cyclase
MAPQPAEALPTDTYCCGSKTVEVGGRKALLTHVYNAHTDGDTWVYFDAANVLDTGDTFTNTGRNPRLCQWRQNRMRALG